MTIINLLYYVMLVLIILQPNILQLIVASFKSNFHMWDDQPTL